jgi:arylsulfatase A-like enzyme
MNLTRRQLLAAPAIPLVRAADGPRPNVVLIITDDQGFGDVAIHGNDKIRTPNMDRIAREGVQFTQFQVCPVCSPTRSSLMTGRYNYRTGVVDTYLGRSMMRPDEVTVAEMLRDAGYRTGIFGKWHLGDNYPLRAMDQGFGASVVLRGGGLGQPSDVPGGGDYFDPILFRNGKPERFKGYCSDIYTNEALSFLDQNASRPFFLYLATNAPHDPLQVAEDLVAPYRRMGLDEQTAKTYAMVENADTNIGRVLSRLNSRGLDRNTIVIFMTDNGPQRPRYNAGMRGIKGTVYQGGIRVPFFLRWPSVVKPGSQVDRIAGHIDVTPTLLEACGVAAPKHPIDGRSLMPLLRNPGAAWQDRTLFTQWHRGDAPEPFRSAAVRTQRWKLVDGKELYDLGGDPAEKTDVAASQPEVVARLRGEYEKWFADVSSKGYDPPRMSIGTRHQHSVVLTRQDWRGPKAAWTPEAIGHWEVSVAEATNYEVKARIERRKEPARITMSLNGASLAADAPPGAEEAILGRTRIAKGDGRVTAEVTAGAKTTGVWSVEITRV